MLASSAPAAVSISLPLTRWKLFKVSLIISTNAPGNLSGCAKSAL
jgi:hypothetical protein